MKPNTILALLVLFGILIPKGIQAATLEKERFSIDYRDTVPDELVQIVVKQMDEGLDILTAYLAQVKSYTGPPYPGKIRVIIAADVAVPRANRNVIYVPEKRLLAILDTTGRQRTGLSIVHELAHVLTASAHAKERGKGLGRFYDEGLGVFLDQRFGHDGIQGYPHFGQDLYRAVAAAAGQNGGFVPLADSEKVRRTATRGPARRLAYLQEGAFTQYLIESYGLNAYFRIYNGEDLKEVTGRTWQELENQWLTLMRAFMPATK